MPAYKLIYFNARGAAEGIRLMFALKGIEFEDFRFEREQWPELKKQMPTGQVPVLEVDGTKFSQSGAILRYLARELGLYGDNAIEQMKIDEVADTIIDMTKNGGTVFFEEDPEKKKAAAKKLVDESFAKFAPFFTQRLKESGSGFVVGSKVSLADILLFRCVEGARDMLSKTLPDYDPYWKQPEIEAHFKKIANIPEISAWMKKRPETMM